MAAVDVDESHNGLDYDHFHLYIRQRELILAKLFKRMDENGDGKICVAVSAGHTHWLHTMNCNARLKWELKCCTKLLSPPHAGTPSLLDKGPGEIGVSGRNRGLVAVIGLG